eukprot:c18450_g1_i2.p1 GENE.c18450_g1_i2~~c18450_g1_i2.p1  ORF type:complete len:521 (+),score=196.61 c18450_g1_i2:35-1564(+)
MVLLILVFEKKEVSVEVSLESGLEVFQSQIFSLFDVEIEDQILISKGKTLSSETDLLKCGFVDNQKVIVMSSSKLKKAALPIVQVSNESKQEDPSEIKMVCSKLKLGEDPIKQPAFVLSGNYICLGCSQSNENKQYAKRCTNPPPYFVCGNPKPKGIVSQASIDLKRGMKSILENANATICKELRTQHRMVMDTVEFGAKSEFKQRVMSSFQLVTQYEDRFLIQKARQVIPIQRLVSEAENEGGNYKRDNLVRRLLHWFKNEFFRWVDQPQCPKCGIKTTAIGSGAPNQSEQSFFAGVVELYVCTKCNDQVRFPRYNHAGKLLETREGRCGEWAQCFTLCCRALDIPARFVSDWTDHVWTEVESEEFGQYVHTDSCENKFNAPLLYEKGWGKKLSYVIAFSLSEVVDVSWRYTEKPNEVLSRRNLVPEDWLKNLVAAFDFLALERASLNAEARIEILEKRKKLQEKWREIDDCDEKRDIFSIVFGISMPWLFISFEKSIAHLSLNDADI